MQKIEHIGIAVRDMEAAISVYTALFGEKPYKQEEVESEHVKSALLDMKCRVKCGVQSMLMGVQQLMNWQE